MLTICPMIVKTETTSYSRLYFCRETQEASKACWEAECQEEQVLGLQGRAGETHWGTSISTTPTTTGQW